MHSNLSHLTNDELIAHLQPRCYKSPVVSELCVRIEQLLLLPTITEGQAIISFPHNMECPVCEAELFINSDNLEVKIK